jgi:predicted dehydrogenase
MGKEDGSGEITRRNVGKATLAAGAGALIASHAGEAAAKERKRRYAIVGVGSRSYAYQEALHKTYAEQTELVAVCDVNEGRMNLARDLAKQHGRAEPAAYAASDFYKMVSQTKPETVIVTSVDATHDDYIVHALGLGCDVITEKPMTTDAAKVQRILDARRKSAKKVTVAFNYRYTPVRSQVKELLMSGVIGDVLSVDFNWVLDTRHGADYFRRWHSQKKHSGGLMVHKSTHHFDLVNWWLSAIPVTVTGRGKRDFYTPQMAKRLGLSGTHDRCLTCTEKALCGFELDLSKNERFKSLYLEQEKYDGYFRDRCVFRPDVDIEDTMNVLVDYDNGATLSYTLNAFSPWEGYIATFNGTKGRLEHKVEERVSLFGDGAAHGAVKADGTYLRVYPLRQGAYQIEPRKGEGGHGGGDPSMIADLFAPPKTPDPLNRAADERSGAYSVLVGIAANQSFVSRQPVKVANLVKNLAYPSYPAMPNPRAPLPMPPKS